MKASHQFQYSIIIFLGLALLATGFFVVDSALLSIAGFGLVFLASSYLFSLVFTSVFTGFRPILGSFVSISWLMIAGSVVYYTSLVTFFTLFFAISSLPVAAYLSSFLRVNTGREPYNSSVTPLVGVLVSVIVVALFGFFASILEFSTVEPTRSPWLVVDPFSLFWLGIAIIATGWLAVLKKFFAVVIGVSVIVFAMLSVALFVFPLGYGFDPFLHQATIDHITLHGTITPKPYYYIGQYSIELILVFVTRLSSHVIDVAMLPILASVFLPVTVGSVFWRITRRPLASIVAVLGVFLLPLGSFINTTPQGLANLWTLVVLLLALPQLVGVKRFVPFCVLALAGFSTLLIHPLAGLPVVLFLTLFFLVTSDAIVLRYKKVLLGIVSVLGAVMLPVAFSVSNSNGDLSFDGFSLSALLPSIFIGTNYEIFDDLFAFLAFNGWIFVLGFAAVAGIYLWRRGDRKWLIYPLSSVLLFINASILSVSQDFSFLIDYEQTNYTHRIVVLCVYVMVPLAVFGFMLALDAVFSRKKFVFSFSVILLVALGGIANAYYIFPRHDAFSYSRGFTVGQSDYDTVSSIRSHAGDVEYVVLANQAVSAAAISDYGFAPYYGENSDVFYYPVPTGGPLYEVFLDMIEDTPTQELARKAMDLTGVNVVYFVVNDYWWSSEVATERAKVETDEWFEINNGKTAVFIFRGY